MRLFKALFPSADPWEKAVERVELEKHRRASDLKLYESLAKIDKESRELYQKHLPPLSTDKACKKCGILGPIKVTYVKDCLLYTSDAADDTR